MMIKNLYNIPTGGKILYAQTQEEIFVDKIIAFTRRPNKVKHRDLYDISFLNQSCITLNEELLFQKLDDRKIQTNLFIEQYKNRIKEILNLQNDFLFEMKRFLPKSEFSNDFNTPLWWEYLINLLDSLLPKIETKK